MDDLIAFLRPIRDGLVAGFRMIEDIGLCWPWRP